LTRTDTGHELTLDTNRQWTRTNTGHEQALDTNRHCTRTDTVHEHELCFCMNLEQNSINDYRIRNVYDKCCWKKR
jgi:hypothetical protein